jgi:Mg-chelatase subunit ChlD
MLTTSLQLIAEAHHGKGDKAAEKAALESAEEISRFGKPAKTVIFVVDKSGSMTSKRINAVREGALALLGRKIYKGDKVGIIEFDDDPNIVSQPREVGDDKGPVGKAILSITPNPPFGRTAFYDAMGDALHMLTQSPPEDMRWVVALTDGADNESVRFAPTTEKTFRKVLRKGLRDYIDEEGLDATVVILGAGREVKDVEKELKFICGPGGYYINVSLKGNIKKSVAKAFTDVEKLFAEQEEIEGFDISEY